MAFGNNPTATAADMLLKAGNAEYFACNDADLVAVIQDTAAGFVYITPTQMV